MLQSSKTLSKAFGPGGRLCKGDRPRDVIAFMADIKRQGNAKVCYDLTRPTYAVNDRPMEEHEPDQQRKDLEALESQGAYEAFAPNANLHGIRATDLNLLTSLRKRDVDIEGY
jgi:hypothetical protein